MCRCANDNSAVCTDKFNLDAANCTVGGVSCNVDDDCKVCDQTTTQACLTDEECPSGEVCLGGLRQPSCVGGQCVGA